MDQVLSFKIEQYHGPMVNQQFSSTSQSHLNSRNLDSTANALTFPAQNIVMAKVVWMKETRKQTLVDDKTGQEVQEMITS